VGSEEYWNKYRKEKLELVVQFIGILKKQKRLRDYVALIKIHKTMKQFAGAFSFRCWFRKLSLRAVYISILMMAKTKKNIRQRGGLQNI
jgi:hypothetical protein